MRILPITIVFCTVLGVGQIVQKVPQQFWPIGVQVAPSIALAQNAFNGDGANLEFNDISDDEGISDEELRDILLQNSLTSEEKLAENFDNDLANINRILQNYENLLDVAPSEIKLLYELSQRRKELNTRETIVFEREALARALESRLEERALELSFLEQKVRGLLIRYDKEVNDDVTRLRQVYTTMKPKSAAAIFNDLDIESLIFILTGIRARDTAPILAAMDATKARELTQALIYANATTRKIARELQTGDGEAETTEVAN